MHRLYKVRISGTEEYWTKQHAFGAEARGVVFSERSAIQWYKHWCDKLDKNISIEFVEYSLIETRIFTKDLFIKNFLKTPIVSTK